MARTPNDQGMFSLGTLMVNKHQMRTDREECHKYVKEEMFYQIVFVFKDTVDQVFDVGGKVFSRFRKNCKERVAGGMLPHKSPEEQEAYMEFLWGKITPKPAQIWLSQKRSNIYTVMRSKFHGM